MKFRSDFITNSSSTSFIISLKGEFTFRNFCKALKITKNFPLLFIIKDIYTTIYENLNPIEYKIDANGEVIIDENQDFYGSCCYFDDEKLVKTMKSLISDGRKVYHGEFSDQDDSHIANYLCFTEILIENDDIFFDSIEDAY